MTTELVFIDLSSLAYPIWHMSQSEPDANHTSQQVIARVQALATGHPHVAICCDSGRSFRRDVAPTYKANRPEHDASLQHQIDLTREALAGDGFPVWAVRSFEADDLIATAVTHTLALPDTDALIVSADKDLLQLIGPRVRVMSARDGSIADAAVVLAKFGVKPEQMRDYLTLVGDASDNIRGVPGIGPKRATELLGRYGSIDGIYADLALHPTHFTPTLATALQAFKATLETTRTLVTLRTDVDLPFAEIANERQAPPMEDTAPAFVTEEEPMTTPLTPETVQAAQSAPITAGPVPSPQTPTVIPYREPEALELVPAQWERQLDPRSMKDARMLATDLHASRMFSAYGTPQAVLSTVLLGRELGLPAMASLRQIHNIEGKHALSAALMVALVLKSGLAEYFEPVEFSATKAVWETKRKGARNTVRLEHTIEMAQLAGLVKPNSNWVKVPTDMLNARCQSRLARMVYPDVVGGLYTPDELIDARQQVA